MPNGLYPEILFHFTTQEGLFGILADNFRVSYARERIAFGATVKEFASPMVSFCDLRLSELKGHMDKYGKFGIGLSKDWANRQGLNPVIYMSKHSPMTASFVAAVEQLYAHIDKQEDGDQYIGLLKSYMDILNLFRYIKNYQGELTRKNGITDPNCRFADEREWRYVPSIDNNQLPFVPWSNMRTDDAKATLNAKLSEHRLIFNPEDIKYLIVDRDSQRLELLDHIERVKYRFDETTRRRLASRILTAEQIENDV